MSKFFHYAKDNDYAEIRNVAFLFLNIQLRGTFNKFPDFFVQVFKIVVDS